MRIKKAPKLYLTANHHIDMSELGSDKNRLELGHVFPEQHSFTRVSHYIYSVLPVSIHEYYVDNIITNMSFPFNLKCKEVVNKNRVESSASESGSTQLSFLFLNFGSENSGRVSGQQYHQSGLKVLYLISIYL